MWVENNTMYMINCGLTKYSLLTHINDFSIIEWNKKGGIYT